MCVLATVVRVRQQKDGRLVQVSSLECVLDALLMVSGPKGRRTIWLMKYLALGLGVSWFQICELTTRTV